MTIQAVAMYPDDKSHRCRVERQRYGQGKVFDIFPPWPAIEVGDEIEIETENHWIWRATVLEVHAAGPEMWQLEHLIASIHLRSDQQVGSPPRPDYLKTPMPLPPLIDGQPYILPYCQGDAWSTRPEKGKVLTIDGQHYKVTRKPKSVRDGYEYTLAPVSSDAHARRPGRKVINDITEPARNIGRVFEIGGEFLLIEKATRVPYGNSEGDIFGHQTIGTGHFVPPARAEKARRAWEAAENVRRLEQALRVAQQDIDYGGNPERVPALRAELAAAVEALAV